MATERATPGKYLYDEYVDYMYMRHEVTMEQWEELSTGERELMERLAATKDRRQEAA